MGMNITVNSLLPRCQTIDHGRELYVEAAAAAIYSYTSYNSYNGYYSYNNYDSYNSYYSQLF